MKNILHTLISVALFLVLLSVTGCGKGPFTRTEAKETNSTETAVPVEVASLVRGPIEAIIPSSTHLEAESEVKVFARTANRVTSLNVEEGDLVAKDQELLLLEDAIQTTQVEKARSNLEKSRSEYQRSLALYEQKLVSDQAFTDIQHQLRQHELALEDARRELEYTTVRAPIAGTVTRRLVKTGDLVTMNQHLFDIVDFDSIVARVHVPERVVGRLRAGQPVRITSTSLPGHGHQGRIQRIAPIVDKTTGTIKVTVEFDDTGSLLPGMYVDVEIIADVRTNALLLSKRALVYDGDQLFAYRLLTNRTVERILVLPRITDQDHLEPASGFSDGDRIVVAGQTGLKHGALVRLPDDPDPNDKKSASPETDETGTPAEEPKTSTNESDPAQEGQE